ncbi:MAG TPA: hypothetical protein VLZ83_01895 [Edaphocola sp.]|nr:hypothetical protein [Edaphocola sp.]
MKKVVSIALFALLSSSANAQAKRDIPVNLETIVGIIRSNTSLTLNKRIQGKFRYMNITSLASYYKNSEGPTEMVSVNSIGYQFHKNIGVYSGIQYHYAKGFMPHIAVSFSHATPDFLIAITPYYNFMPFNGLETIGVIEFKPKLGRNTRLFTRFQGLYGHNLDTDIWAREMLYFRAGISIKQYTFGLASQFDYYKQGNRKVLDYGAFVRLALFN